MYANECGWVRVMGVIWVRRKADQPLHLFVFLSRIAFVEMIAPYLPEIDIKLLVFSPLNDNLKGITSVKLTGNKENINLYQLCWASSHECRGSSCSTDPTETSCCSHWSKWRPSWPTTSVPSWTLRPTETPLSWSLSSMSRSIRPTRPATRCSCWPSTRAAKEPASECSDTPTADHTLVGYKQLPNCWRVYSAPVRANQYRHLALLYIVWH